MGFPAPMVAARDRVAEWKLWTYRPTLFGKALLLVATLVVINGVIWALSAGILAHKVLGFALLAWTTGLRHALDADHITAIDNTVRRIMSGAGPGEKDPKDRRELRRRLRFWRQRRSKPTADTERAPTQGPALADQGDAIVPQAEPEDEEYVYDGDVGPDDAVAPDAHHRLPTPITAGSFFSLGHSTIVVAVIIAVAVSASVAGNLGSASSVGNVIGTSVSGGLLMILCLINLCILVSSIRQLKRFQRELRATSGGNPELAEDGLLQWRPKGCMSVLAMPLLRATDRAWKMYPIGVLFGLGFDTSSTLAVISVSAIAAVDAPRRNNASVVLFAFLFASGMCLVDSLDSIMAVYVYAPSEMSSRFALWERRWKPPTEIPMDKSMADERDADKDDKDEDKGMDEGESSTPSGAGEKEVTAKTSTEECQDAMPTLDEAVGAKGAPAQLHRRPLLFMLGPATQIQLLMTALSIAIAFAIGLIQILSLIGSRCSQCAAAAERQEEHGDGGLAGRWWLAWQNAADNLTYIGAGIAGFFFAVLTTAILTRWYIAARNKRRARAQQDWTSSPALPFPPSPPHEAEDEGHAGGNPPKRQDGEKETPPEQKSVQ